MEQTKKVPAEAVDLYTRYIHGEVSRRDFFEGVKRYAVGGLTASPQAFRLSVCPTASKRKPSSLMLRAAFMSRSWTVPQIGHSRT